MDISALLAAISALTAVIVFLYQRLEKAHSIRVKGLEAELRQSHAENERLREALEA